MTHLRIPKNNKQIEGSNMAGLTGNDIIKFLGALFGISFLRRNLPYIGSILFLIYVSYLGWMCLGPQKPAPDVQRQKIADVAVQKMTEEIRDKRENIRNVVLLHFHNDPTDYISDSLRNSLNATGILTLTDTSFEEKLSKKLNLRCKDFSSSKEVQEAIANHDVQGVLWGKIDIFESHSTGAVLKGEWFLDEKGTGRRIASGVIHEDSSSPLKKTVATVIDNVKENNEDLESATLMLPWYIRFLGFILLVMLLPIVTISFIRTMVAKGSNKINAFLLSIYTTIDAIFAFFMVGGSFLNFGPVIFFLLALAIAFFYNVQIMSFALRLEKK